MLWKMNDWSKGDDDYFGRFECHEWAHDVLSAVEVSLSSRWRRQWRVTPAIYYLRHVSGWIMTALLEEVSNFRFRSRFLGQAWFVWPLSTLESNRWECCKSTLRPLFGGWWKTTQTMTRGNVSMPNIKNRMNIEFMHRNRNRHKNSLCTRLLECLWWHRNGREIQTWSTDHSNRTIQTATSHLGHMPIFGHLHINSMLIQAKNFLLNALRLDSTRLNSTRIALLLV